MQENGNTIEYQRLVDQEDFYIANYLSNVRDNRMGLPIIHAVGVKTWKWLDKHDGELVYKIIWKERGRVSTKEQNLDRQIIDLKKAGVDERYIYFDKASGKNFNRRSWNTLVGTLDTAPVLREGDLLVVSSLDRMGRNYTEIQEQWQYITHELKADIRVIDMPMLDTSKNTDNLDRRFIADLVLQILSYTAQKERENIHKRQEMGIAAAQSKGVKFGRPKAQYPAEWKVTYKAWKDGQITATAAMEKMGIKRTTFYKLVKRYEQKED